MASLAESGVEGTSGRGWLASTSKGVLLEELSVGDVVRTKGSHDDNRELVLGVFDVVDSLGAGKKIKYLDLSGRYSVGEVDEHFASDIGLAPYENGWNPMNFTLLDDDQTLPLYPTKPDFSELLGYTPMPRPTFSLSPMSLEGARTVLHILEADEDIALEHMVTEPRPDLELVLIGVAQNAIRHSESA